MTVPPISSKDQLEVSLLQAKIEREGAERDRALEQALQLKNANDDWNRYRANDDASVERRRVYIFDTEVNKATVRDCIQELDHWSARDTSGAIQIIFCSPGGSVIHGLALYDFIQLLRGRGHHITTTDIGYAASMGGILLQAGDKRVIGANAFLMIHEIASLGIGKLSEMQDEVAFMKRLQNEKLVPILAARAKVSPAEITVKMERRDWWLSAEEAVDLGFADEVQFAPPFVTKS